MKWAEAARTLRDRGVRFVRNQSLSELSTFRIGGAAELAVFPTNREELSYTLELLRRYDCPLRVIGNGSNVLFGDGLLKEALIVTKEMSSVRWMGEELYAESGASLSSLAISAAERGLTGLEFLRGIPGTLGGAVVMNAGAHGGEMGQTVVESHAYDCLSGQIVTLTDHGFGYRQSVYLSNPRLICIGARLRLSSGARQEIEERMREYTRIRRERQPLEYPSGGSYFKRPEGHFAGKLIEDCGLKGYRIGNAAVSEKHAGFLINLGGATAEEVLLLEQHVRRCVLERFGVELTREVHLIR